MLGNFSYSNPTTKMKKLVILLLAFVLCVSLGACGSRQKEDSQQTEETENAPKKVVAKDGADMQTEDKSMPTRIPMEGGTKINMYFGDTLITGVLNDSETAKALIKKLPMTQQVSRYSHDFCGVTEELPYNEDEDTSEQYGDQVNIGVITCPLEEISKLEGTYDVRIELAE